jgi:hypothetical protein
VRRRLDEGEHTSNKFCDDMLDRRGSLDGRGGAFLEFLAAAPPYPFSPSSTGCMKSESSLLLLLLSCPSSMRIPFSEDGRPMRTRASRDESWLGFSRRSAFCIAARAVGDGGLGAGFIACATVSGIVGMLTEDTTGSVQKEGHWW